MTTHPQQLLFSVVNTAHYLHPKFLKIQFIYTHVYSKSLITLNIYMHMSRPHSLLFLTINIDYWLHVLYKTMNIPSVLISFSISARASQTPDTPPLSLSHSCALPPHPAQFDVI